MFPSCHERMRFLTYFGLVNCLLFESLHLMAISFVTQRSFRLCTTEVNHKHSVMQGWYGRL